ncbi:helix-turn-helix domain-containing protein [Rummeliibacillus stabekisii]|uniref:helix-turn-helix domain-containing protein n=1 Tax=Rummeliibacillus stabekisii TaxID=241244 RepID=UPI00203E30E0|nr:helix-turn-helix domain-containing protein [Rummeliibacillus stabekisii]MCM3318019.1 helix-turn-helix domain-containing protein [Rummeliibacillus stabekisii]
MVYQNSGYYTKEEVAKLLNIAESTVYRYAEQGKIQTEPNPYRMKKSTRYTKESVEQFLQSQKADGITVDGLAKKLKISKARIYQLLQQNDELDVIKTPYGANNYKYLIPASTQKAISKLLRKKKSKGAKKDFYNSQYNIALFQLFRNDYGKFYRIFKNERNEWGLYLNGTNNFVDYKTAMEELKIEPSYALNNRSSLKNNGYGHFEVPKDESGFLFIDYFYQHLGINNMYVNEQSETIDLFLKETNIPLDKCPLPSELTIDIITSIEGDIYIDEESFHILKGHKSITFSLSLPTIKQLQSYVKSHNLTTSEVTEKAILEYLKKQQQE